MGKTLMGEDGRKGLFVLGAIMGLALAALIYFLFVVHPPEQQTSSAAPSQAPAAPTVAKLVAGAQSPTGADETNLCGVGWVRQSAVEDIRAQARAAADAAFTNLKGKLAASRDTHQRALGLYLQGSTEALVALASGSGDAQVYALALLSCRYNGCGSLSAREWAGIEPDNGAPWLLVAAGAEGAARDQAIYRVSAAQRFDPHLPNLLELLQLPEIRDQAPQTRSVLGEDLLAMRLTLPSPPFRPLFQYCSYPSVAEASHLGVCNDLARLFIGRDTTMLGLGVGARLAQSANWSPADVEKILKKKTEYETALRAATSQETDKASSDCEELDDFERWAADYSRLGDRGVATKYIEEATAHEKR